MADMSALQVPDRNERRRRWIEARTRLAEELVRFHVGSPMCTLDELRKSSSADQQLFNATVSHLVAARRLPRALIKNEREIANERRDQLVAHLALCGGCPVDSDELRAILNDHDTERTKRAIAVLIESNKILVLNHRVFLPPDDVCLNSVVEALDSAKFSMDDVANTEAVKCYADRAGLPAEQVAPIVAQILERQSRIVNLGEGKFRSRKSVSAVLRRIRAAVREFRPYGIDELRAASCADEATFQFSVHELKLRETGEGQFTPTGYFRRRGWPCSDCKADTRTIDDFFKVPLCLACRKRNRKGYRWITKTRAVKQFRLREHELYRLNFVERDNPHYKCASPMHLFLLSQVQDLARTKWGSDEPYLISLTEVSPDQLHWLQEDPERLKQLNPEQFERLLADRIEAMGMRVQLIGRTNSRDGGIDLIAYPDPRSNQPKYLLAVQAEHHRGDSKTGAPKVQKFVGAMSAVPQFRLGFVVTNTSFTWTAEEYARSQNHFLRLRSLEDLLRWLRDDFNNEAEWREIPDVIQFGGFRVPILKPKLSLGQRTKPR